MNQVNSNIILSPTRLNRPLPTFYARLLHSFVATISNIPDDVTGVVVRVFNVGLSSYYDIPCGRRPDGTAKAYIIGTCFPGAGSAQYEIHGFDAQGNQTALGMGYVLVEGFSTSGSAITPGASVTLDRIKDASGTYHTIKAVPDGTGGYTTIIDDTTGV